MNENTYSKQELRFTAVLYATRRDVVEHLQSTGKLPKHFYPGGLHIAANMIGRTRGRDPILNEIEQQIYEAILSEKRLSGGEVILAPNSIPIYSLQQDQSIEIR
jgi:hypothetical protein